MRSILFFRHFRGVAPKQVVHSSHAIVMGMSTDSAKGFVAFVFHDQVHDYHGIYAVGVFFANHARMPAAAV
jgi:hypothetical protein